MSALQISFGRKRHHSPDLGDSEDSSESEDLPPLKKHKDNGDIPLQFVDKLAQISNWLWDLNVNKFAKMALLAGSSAYVHKCEQKEFKDDSNNEEEEEEDDDLDLKDDDDDIQEIKENINQEKLSPLIKQFGNSHFPNDSVRSKQQRSAMNGSFHLGSHYNSSKLNGTSARDLSTRYHGTTNCNLRREQTEKLKRQPVISNPATEIEVILGSEPEVVTLEGDGIEILSESPRSKQKSTSSQKSFRSSVKSTSKNATSALKQSQLTPIKKTSSSASRSYTANEVVRLQEKAQYKLLLEKYISGPQYHHVSKKSQLDEEGSNKEDSRVLPNSHFKKQVLEQPIDSFIQKYYTPCRLLSPKKKESSEQNKEPPETVTLDDDEDEEIQIVDMKLPKYKARITSEIFSPNWLTELGKHVRFQTEERNKIVQDYEQKLEKLKKERLLRQLTVDVSDRVVEPEFPELTPEMEEAVDNVWQTGSAGDVICKTINNNNLIRKDFESLEGLHWLNDTIINSYFDLIVERSKKEGYPTVYAFNTFFYGNLKGKGYSAIRRWTRKIDIFSYDLNFVPIHLAFHWCLAVIDHRSKKIAYYDSMGNGEESCLDVLHEYLCLEYKDKKGQILDPSIYVTETMKDIPQQMNGSDCGMFTLKYAEYIARNAEITFDQQHMNYFRRRTVYEVLTNQLL